MAKPIRKIKTFFGMPNFIQLFPPPKTGTYKYFKDADRFPFDAKTKTHSPVNGWWLAEFSLLAYAERQETEQVTKKLFAYQKHSFFWLESGGATIGSNTQGFGIETEDYVIIAFRGTEFPPPSTMLKAPEELLHIIADIRTDIQKLAPETVLDGTPIFDTPVNSGFANALQSIWQQLQERLPQIGGKPLWLTGHSLGGAIATLLAYQLPDRVSALYTFGSPCVGTFDFQQAFNRKGLHEKTFRYVHGNDAVAKALESFTFEYHHVGEPMLLDAGSRRGLLAQILNIALGATIGVNQLDHAPIFYTYECWNAIP